MSDSQIEPGTERFAFITEWYDPYASLTRQYQLVYWPHDCSVEMHDIKANRVFLRRTTVDVLPEQMHVGSTINVLSRQLNIIGYGDKYTEKRLSSHSERTLAIIKPEAVPNLGEIITIIEDSSLKIVHMRMMQMSRDNAAQFYDSIVGKSFYSELVEAITKDKVVALELMGPNAVQRWLNLLGPVDVEDAKERAPCSIRAQFATNAIYNACHGSASQEDACKELDIFFGRKFGRLRNTALFQHSTLCIIKPHMLLSGACGRIMSCIRDAGFSITALGMYILQRPQAEEFFAVYKDVLPEYCHLVQEITSGPCIALEITGPQDNIVQAFREFVGPKDSELAKQIRPHTLRAHFGINKTHNAVHCTDLPDDGPLEVEYFFKLLDYC